MFIKTLIFIFQNFCHSCFWINFVSKSDVFQIDWDLVEGYYYVNVYFFEIFVIHIVLANLVPKPDVVPSMWNLAFQYLITLYLDYNWLYLDYSNWMQKSIKNKGQ